MQLLETSNSILLLEFIEVILHQELVLYDFPSVVLHMTELSVDLTGVLVGSWLFCIQHSMFGKFYGACSEPVWRFGRRIFYIDPSRAKLILACQEVLK